MFVIDVETSGIDPNKHSILSIGAVEFFNPENRIYIECQAWEDADYMEESLRINGFQAKDLTDTNKPTLQEGIAEFLDWAYSSKSSKVIAGQHPSFDRDFLRSSASKYNLKWKFGYKTLDLYSIFMSKLLTLDPNKIKDTRQVNLDYILNYVGLPAEPAPHNALNGAVYETEAFSRLLYRRNKLPEFRQFPLPSYI